MAELVREFVTGAQGNAPRAEAGPDGRHLRVGMCCKVNTHRRPPEVPPPLPAPCPCRV